MRYGDGWAYDSTHSHYKRAKPTQTDPEDDSIADPSLPMGSTSKTYDPRKDGSFWTRKDSGQEWSHSPSSSGYWRPKLRHEKYFSSAAGDTSEASIAANRLGSIHEAHGCQVVFDTGLRIFKTVAIKSLLEELGSTRYMGCNSWSSPSRFNLGKIAPFFNCV